MTTGRSSQGKLAVKWRALVVETWRDIDGYRADEYNRFCPWLA